jgi:hypothetical protein
MISSYKHADTPVFKLARLFSDRNVECGFIAPPETALKKSIIDAVLPLRVLFQRNGFHSYETQKQGPEHKIVRECFLVDGRDTELSKISLYRPNTKNGDPRLWIQGLGKFAEPNNVLALFFWEENLYIVNCSTQDIREQLNDPSTFIGHVAAAKCPRIEANFVAEELLGKLRAIAKLGAIESMRSGSTGIGFTLEAMLGIAANSSKTPDYQGIEIKSGRISIAVGAMGRQPRITLFSKTPSSTLSPYTASEALDRYGYYCEEKRRTQLYCSIDSEKRNTLGFILGHDLDGDSLLAKNNKKLNSVDESVFVWQLNELRTAFAEKHKETFWVGATSEKIDGKEWLHYKMVRHTKDPSIFMFELCLLAGGICLDLTLSRLPTGRVRDHGYLFRVYREAFEELFPSPVIHNLT